MGKRGNLIDRTATHNFVIVKIDTTRDLALIYFESNIKYEPVRLAERAVEGERIRYVGYPKVQVKQEFSGFLLKNKMRGGIWPRYMWSTSITAGPGASGAAVLNKDNELVGVLVGMAMVWPELSIVVPLYEVKDFLKGEL